MIGDIIYGIVLVIGLVIWLVRLESKVNNAARLAEENKKWVRSLDNTLRMLEKESAILSKSIPNMESEIRQIKEFLTKDGFSKLKSEVINGVAKELSAMIVKQ